MIVGSSVPKSGSTPHWYDRSGALVTEVPRKDGNGMRPVNVSDARALGLLPSVTTVLQILNHPNLNDWKIKKAVEAYAAYPHDGVDGAIESMYKIGRDAADMGTLIHQGIERGFRGMGEVPAEVHQIVSGFWQWYSTSGLVCEQPEHTFVNVDLGYAGTADFEGTLNGKPILVDFKTQDIQDRRGANFYEPEWPLQLAGYDIGLGQDRPRMSIVISRSVPGLIVTKTWEDTRRWNAAWNAVFEAWCHLKNYYPGNYPKVVT